MTNITSFYFPRQTCFFCEIVQNINQKKSQKIEKKTTGKKKGRKKKVKRRRNWNHHSSGKTWEWTSKRKGSTVLSFLVTCELMLFLYRHHCGWICHRTCFISYILCFAEKIQVWRERNLQRRKREKRGRNLLYDICYPVVNKWFTHLPAVNFWNTKGIYLSQLVGSTGFSVVVAITPCKRLHLIPFFQ